MRSRVNVRDFGRLVAIDVGGTTIKGARFGADGVVERRRTVATPTLAGQAAVVEAVTGVAAGLLEQDVAAVGLSVPGLVDSDGGIVRYSTNLGLRDVALGPLLQDRLGVPVLLQQDVRAACEAEASLGIGVGETDFVEVVIGTGLAAGIIVRGELLFGRGGAGELGHLPVVPGGEKCGCGARGCAEVYASAGGIARRYHAAGGSKEMDAAAVVAALATDPLADRIWTEAVGALARALAAAVVVTDPSLFVIAGGLSRAGALLTTPLSACLSELLPWQQVPPIRTSPLGADAGLWGAAITAAKAATWEITSWKAGEETLASATV